MREIGTWRVACSPSKIVVPGIGCFFIVCIIPLRRWYALFSEHLPPHGAALTALVTWTKVRKPLRRQALRLPARAHPGNGAVRRSDAGLEAGGTGDGVEPGVRSLPLREPGAVPALGT